MTVLDYALAYARHGWFVLPLKPRQKMPLQGQGLKHATRDELAIARWFSGTPGAGIGIAMAASGLVAVDIDPRSGGDLALRDDLPQTLTATTGGGGLHLVYRMPPGARVRGQLQQGVDLKHHGYIAVEPSLHPSGKSYAWLDWEVLEGEIPSIADAPARLLAAAQDRPPRAAEAPHAGHAEPIAEGRRNTTLTALAGRLRRSGLSGDAIEAALQRVNTERCMPALADAEVRSIARSVARYAPAPQAERGVEGEASDPWPEPLLPGAITVPDFAPDLLGGWAGAMAAAVASTTQTPPAMAAMTTLTVLAAVLQRRFEVAPYGDDYREPLAIWTMTALGSGNRKTAVQKLLVQPLVDWEKQQRDRSRSEIARIYAEREVLSKRIETLKLQAGKEDRAEARAQLQQQIAELREQMPNEVFAPRLFSGDVTAERLQQLLVEQDERIAIISDEGGVFQIMAGAYSGGLSSLDVFLQGHAGAAIRVDRAGRLAHIDRPAVSFGLALQPGILQEHGKTRRFRDSGLMARFLYAVPRSTVGLRDVRDRRPLPDGVAAEYERQLFALLDNVPRPFGAPRVLPFTAQARELWLDLCERMERQQGDGGRFAHIVDWTSKLPGAAARIAALLALAEHGTGLQQIDVEPVRRAVALAELLLPHAEAAFALMGAADGEQDAQAVLAYIRRHQLAEVVRRDLQKGMEGRFRSLERLLAAIKLLQDWHVLGRERKTEGAGRPSIFYVVNPKALAAASTKAEPVELRRATA